MDWSSFFAALTDVGYRGPVCIEVEDRAYEGSLEDRERACGKVNATWNSGFDPRPRLFRHRWRGASGAVIEDGGPDEVQETARDFGASALGRAKRIKPWPPWAMLDPMAEPTTMTSPPAT